MIVHILRLKHVIEEKKEGRMEMTGRRGRRRKQLSDDLEETKGYCKKERRSTRSHSVENSIWKRLWTFRNTEYAINGRVKQVFFSKTSMQVGPAQPPSFPGGKEPET